MRFPISACIAMIAGAICLPAAQAADAFEQNRRLGRGVNIIGYDPIWRSRDQGRFQEKHFKLLKEAGFQTVRVNLHPFRHMAGQEPWALRESWFATLDWVVEQASRQQLMVILDCHEFNAMGDDVKGNQAKFFAFWRQLASHCRNAPDNVVFEILNEPSKQVTPPLWNQFLTEALAVIRETNPNRTVIVGPASWNAIDFLPKLELPKEDRNLVVTVHYYKPMEFTHQGAPWSDHKQISGLEWQGTEAERKAIRTDFDKAAAWAKEHNRPLFLGEFGAYDKAPLESRVRYTDAVARTAESLGWSWAYWQFDSDFILWDMQRDAWFEPILHALVPAGEKPDAARVRPAQWLAMAEVGDPLAQALLARAYHYPTDGMVRDREAARGWALKAAAQDHPLGHFMMGMSTHYDKTIGKDERERKAAAHFENAIRAGIMTGAGQGGRQWMALAGDACFAGFGVAKSDEKAMEWWLKASDLGDGNAYASMAYCFRAGWGVAKDNRKAAEFFRIAAESGDTAGMLGSGDSCLMGIGIPNNEEQALKWFRRAVEVGSPEAMVELGEMFAEGRGVAKDEKTAIEWYRKAASLENLGGMIQLATCYADGIGVPLDDEQAMSWYRKAADLESAETIFTCGFICEKGLGVPTNRKRAIKLYRAAEKLGHRPATEALDTVVNDLFRAGIAASGETLTPRPRIQVKSRPLGLRPAYNPDRLNQLAEELEVEDFLRRASKDDSARH